MSEIKALVLKNELNLPQEKVDSLVSSINNRHVAPLSPDKEIGPFLLFCTGDDLQTISVKTNYPIDIVIVTAIYYRWYEKAAKLGLTDSDATIETIKQDITKTLLVATSVSVKKMLGDVIAGRTEGKDCALIPKNVSALMTMLSALEGKKEEPAGKGSVTNIKAENVQILNPGPEKEEKGEVVRISADKRKALEDF
jgi:hypothetical protein